MPGTQFLFAGAAAPEACTSLGVAFGDTKMDLAASSPRSDSAPGSSITAMAVGALGTVVP